MQLIPTKKVPIARNRSIAYHVLQAIYSANEFSPVLATSVSKIALQIEPDMNASAVMSELHQHGHAKKVRA
jgi:hypothetical protein